MADVGFNYTEFWAAFYRLEYLRYYLDYAMWLSIEYDGKPADTPASLKRDPRLAFEAEIDACIAEYKSELVYRYCLCSRCGHQFGWSVRRKPCPRTKMLVYADAEAAVMVECGGELLELYCIDEPESRIRENAGFFLAKSGNVASRIHAVSSWIMQALPDGTECDDVPAELVFDSLHKLMDRDLDNILRNVPNIEFDISGRRDLLPTGKELVEKHTDYETLRYDMVNAQRRLVGEARRLKEFQDDYRAPDHPINPPDPIKLPSGITIEPKIDDLAAYISKIANEQIQLSKPGLAMEANGAEVTPVESHIGNNAPREQWVSAKKATEIANRVSGVGRDWSSYWKRFCEKYSVTTRPGTTQDGGSHPNRREVEMSSLIKAILKADNDGEFEKATPESTKRKQAIREKFKTEFSISKELREWGSSKQ